MNATFHLIPGVGVGVLLASPIFYPHPLRWGLVLIGIGVLGHLYAAWSKK